MLALVPGQEHTLQSPLRAICEACTVRILEAFNLFEFFPPFLCSFARILPLFSSSRVLATGTDCAWGVLAYIYTYIYIYDFGRVFTHSPLKCSQASPEQSSFRCINITLLVCIQHSVQFISFYCQLPASTSTSVPVSVSAFLAALKLNSMGDFLRDLVSW